MIRLFPIHNAKTLTDPVSVPTISTALRVALWYGTNGLSSMIGSFLAWALSFATGAKVSNRFEGSLELRSPRADFAFSFLLQLHVYQILFLVVGLATVITGPIILYVDLPPSSSQHISSRPELTLLFPFFSWRLDNSPAEARFLNAEEKTWAVERLRDNQVSLPSRWSILSNAS